MIEIIYIAPSAGEETHAAQARIYSACFDRRAPASVRDHFRASPGEWKEVGLMNFEGKLVCFEGTDEQRQELLDSQPLMAGAYLTYETKAAHHVN